MRIPSPCTLRARAATLALVTLVLCSAPSAPAEDAEREERWIRVERPLWRRALGAPALLLEALHWPARRFAAWAEGVRIDRRIRDAVVGEDNDDRPVVEPADDDLADATWWDFYASTVLRPVTELVDPGEAIPRIGRIAGVVPPDEAVNVNALDEVPDSTWFTNRHARERLSAEALARGPNRGAPPAAEGPILVVSGKAIGAEPGFWVRDREGREFLLRFDLRGHPELATGAEIVAARILHALGWNVPETYLFALDERRLEIDPAAWIRDDHGDEVPFTRDRLARILAGVARDAEGRIRTVASRRIPGASKGGFRMWGTRADDANDTIPHEDRRDLRGLRVVAAWIDHVDFRRANTLDVFVRRPGDPPGHGRLIHHLVDLNGVLGAWGSEPKPPWLGHEWMHEVVPVALRTLRLSDPPWTDVPIVHRSIGRFGVAGFDPDEWKPIYPVAPFRRATLRDRFWGARLVASITDEDLRVIVGAAEWSDPAAADLLVEALRERRQVIAASYFDDSRLAPLDHFVLDGRRLRFRDLAVTSGAADPSLARYRVRSGELRTEIGSPQLELPAASADPISIETSHDEGVSWSPPVALSLERGRVTAIERETR